jgi:branched-chain amino acid transport system ATP-binding protein
MSLIEVEGLNTYYADSHILFDVAMRVERHEVVALLGRNGAGKSTTLKSLMGVARPRSGRVKFDGIDIAGRRSHDIAKAGMQLVHEELRIFGSLSVEENIAIAGITAPNRWPLERIYAMFPRLKQAATNFPAVNSRCWRLRAHWCAIPKSFCWTSRSRVSPPSLSRTL